MSPSARHWIRRFLLQIPFACKALRTVSAIFNPEGGLALLFQRLKLLRRQQKVNKAAGRAMLSNAQRC